MQSSSRRHDPNPSSPAARVSTVLLGLALLLHPQKVEATHVIRVRHFEGSASPGIHDVDVVGLKAGHRAGHQLGKPLDHLARHLAPGVGLEVGGSLSASPARIELTDLAMSLGESHAVGELTLALAGERPRLDGALAEFPQENGGQLFDGG